VTHRYYRIRRSPRRRLRSLWPVQRLRRPVRILWLGKPPAALLPSARSPSLQEEEAKL